MEAGEQLKVVMLIHEYKYYHVHCQLSQLKILLRPRMWHMGCSYHIGERQTDVVVYGGNKQRQSKYERHVMTDVVIFRFG